MIQAFAFAYVAVVLLYLFGTFLLSRRKRPIPQRGFEPAMFVFVVPALNESAVIGPTVESLAAACGDRGRVVVVDDGSTDDTAAVVKAVGSPKVMVLTRYPPDAQLGKGRALNHAYRFVHRHFVARGYDPQDVVLCIVDADGRVEPDVLDHVSPYFRDPKVGAVQLLVRIRNRRNWLCRFQDYEFLVFSSLSQTAREHVGSVGLGGNGQFTRLSALVELGQDPWTDCLTEDLDLGLRLAINGWQNRFCGETFVDQQGLTSVRKLVRQRTRWAHGHFQCWGLIPQMLASGLPTATVLDLSYYLLAPGAVLLASALFTATILWTVYQTATYPEFWLTPFGLAFGVLGYLLSFGPAIALAMVYRSRSRELSLPATLRLGHLLAVYNYIWYIAEWKAIIHIISKQRQWQKTVRVRETLRSPER